jgi:hypothetical protein
MRVPRAAPEKVVDFRERQALDVLAAEKKLCVVAICIWEVPMLSSRARIEVE